MNQSPIPSSGKRLLCKNVQTDSGPHPASYSVGAINSLPGDKAAGHEDNHTPSSSANIKNVRN